MGRRLLGELALGARPNSCLPWGSWVTVLMQAVRLDRHISRNGK